MNIFAPTGLFIFVTLVFSLVFGGSQSFAQGDEDENLDTFESEIKKTEIKTRVTEAHSNASAQPIKSISDLSQLAPFSEVSVLQKRWMPKSSRFQLFGGLSATTNDPWFLTLGANLKAAYGLTEAFGLEFSYISFSPSASNNAKDLEENNGVLTSTFVTPKSYLGAELLWTPFYGKMTRMNEQITPFDMYFSFGLGQMALANSKKASASTVHIGTGQIYALTRNLGLRWDLSVLNYSAESNDGVGNSFNNVLLTVGASFYFPGVNDR